MKRIIFILLSLFLLIGLFSCGKGENENDSDDDTGRTAVLFSSLAEIWTEAGGEIDITVGETVERGLASEGTLLVDDGAGKTINTELLLSYKPELVICSSDVPAQVEVAKILEDAGIKTLTLRVETFSDYLAALKTMTEITGNNDVYIEKGEKLKEEIESLLISERVAELAGTRILFIRAGSSVSSVKSKTEKDHFAAAMLSDLGCVNIGSESPLESAELGMESILAADPEFIFFSLMGNEEAARANVEKILCGEAWSALTAVKEGRVVILPKDLFHFKPCSRWYEAYAFLADILCGGFEN